MGTSNSQIENQPQLIKIHNKEKILSYIRVFEEEIPKTIEQPTTDESNQNNVHQKPISILKIPSLNEAMKERNENHNVKEENSKNISNTSKCKILQNEQELKVLNPQSSPSLKIFKHIKVTPETQKEDKAQVIKSQIIEKIPFKSPKVNKAKLNNPIRKELQRVYDL